MRVLEEAASQLAYQRKLSSLLGARDALRFRGAMFFARFGWHHGKTLSLAPASLAHPVDLRIASTDAEVYGQVIRNAEYEAVAVGRPLTILDCGANVGYTSAFFLSRFPQARVIAIEPFAANAAACRRNLAPYGDRATVIQAGVWSKSGRLVVEFDGGNEWGIRVRAVQAGETGDVDAIDIPSLGLDHIDILKIDIEGSEMELFSAHSEAWLPRVSSIAIELHGAACESVFRAALADYTFTELRSGELTICLDLKKDVTKTIQSGDENSLR